MLHSFSARLALLAVTILIVSFGLGALVFTQTSNLLVAGLVFMLAATSLVLASVVTRVWVVERYPAIRNRLEAIPGVAFSVPVPEHIQRKVQINRPAFTELNKAPQYSGVVTEPTPQLTKTPEPFTLGTLAFEPPEPINPVEIPTLEVNNSAPQTPVLTQTVGRAAPASLEQAFRKTPINSARNIRDSQLKRFQQVCRLLKQTNLEVSVWTEGELATLANTMLGPKSDDKDMLALLMPQNLVKIKTGRTFEFEYHASVLNNILLATGNRVAVEFVNSSKEGISGYCEVNFEYQGKPISWRFQEKGNQLSEAFLQRALAWVAKRANGQFHVISDDEFQKTYVFVPHSISMLLKSESAVA